MPRSRIKKSRGNRVSFLTGPLRFSFPVSGYSMRKANIARRKKSFLSILLTRREYSSRFWTETVHIVFNLIWKTTYFLFQCGYVTGCMFYYDHPLSITDLMVHFWIMVPSEGKHVVPGTYPFDVIFLDSFQKAPNGCKSMESCRLFLLQSFSLNFRSASAVVVQQGFGFCS